MTGIELKKPAEETPLALFDRWAEQVRASEPAWLAPIRKGGIARFAELGFPTVRQEDWRFTNIDPVRKLPFKLANKPASNGSTLVLDRYPLNDLDGIRLVFIDGFFSVTHSALSAPQSGAMVVPLSQSGALSAPNLEQQLGRTVGADGNAFAALNTAYFTDGALIRIDPGVQLERPVHLIFVSTGTEAGRIAHTRNLIIVGARAAATVIESYVALNDAAYVTNSVTELVAGAESRLEHIRFQDESRDAYHFGNLHADLGKASNVVTHSFALGGKLARYNIRTLLNGEHLECILNGLYLCRGEQLADHHMVVNHSSPHCASHEYFNGVLAEKSRGVFHGRILVQQAAQKTDAKQTNKNVLLSEEAVVDSKPQLEIYADDVKCTHGATVGRLDADAIFYMRARGIPEETARRMLMHAFAAEIVDRVRLESARERIDKVVWERLETHAAAVPAQTKPSQRGKH